jgi:hypothetical protein
MSETAFSSKRYLTIRQTAQAYPAMTESALRWLRFNGDSNGFNRCVCDALLSRADAQLEAARITAALARNRAAYGHPYWRPSRATPSCWLRCPPGQGQSIPYPSARPRSTCARAPSPAPSLAVLSSPRPRSRPRGRAGLWSGKAASPAHRRCRRERNRPQLGAPG